MAGQPDISSILAALASRPTGTPAQGAPVQQPGYPGALPPGYPGQVPTPQLGGYALPQPTSSGSVDLSQIRPINSGSVSIAEAIAKAKSIAQDKGFHDGRQSQASPRDDPRLSGRASIRSRSRSPGRRDAFRDNYNPYRDERRDMDRRDRNYQRDRSNSPATRARGNFSPAPQRGSRPSPGAGRNNSGGGNGGGAGGNETETISVKSALVGLIIGRQGENLRRVESETGARVQFIPAREPNATQRQCTISGPLRARENAKREIFRVIDDNGGPGDSAPPDARGAGGSFGGRGSKQPQQPALRDGENSIQIMVPDKTVGLIIGRGGETIRDLQERSGCHVNIVAENKSIEGLRPVNLIGTPQAARIAQDMIMEIVESDTQGRSNAGPAPSRGGPAAFNQGGGYNAGAGGFGRDDGGKSNEDIYVPSEAVGMIIGKGGETIKEMQNVTGCKINVSQPQQPDIQRQIGLVGTRAAIEEAKRAIRDKVDTVQQRDRQGGRDRGNNRNDGPDDRYSQPQQQQSYGQQPMGGAAQGMQGMPAMPGMPQAGAAPSTGSDPNAADPYAAYGGYQNYVQMWYAALAQQGAQGQQPPMSQ
ncbi:hypothetical protein MBLNU459_g8081t1 [Dothideomycetes sp. NU459]